MQPRPARESTSTASLPDFENPPVVEVVLSVGFQPIEGLGVVGLAQLWEAKFRNTLPKVEEQPRFDMPIEPLPPAGQHGPSVSFQLLPAAPLPRLWFLNAEGSELVQVQNDWFAHNWRRTPGASDYPRYPGLHSAFMSDLAAFEAHLADGGLPGIVPTQCEVSYINHIVLADLGQDVDLASVLTLVDNRSAADFDHPRENTRIATQYLITRDMTPVGRLYVTAEPAIRRLDGQSIAVLTLTARGAPIGEGVPGVTAFLDLGREWALSAFVSLTRPEMHRIWRKTGGD